MRYRHSSFGLVIMHDMHSISPNELTGLCLYYCMITSQWHWQTPKSWTIVGLQRLRTTVA